MKFSKTFLKNKTILVTGGTGSFGQLFVSHIIKNFKQIKKIIVPDPPTISLLGPSSIFSPFK